MSKPRDGASYYRALNKAQAKESLYRKAAEAQKAIRDKLQQEIEKEKLNAPSARR